MDLTEYAKSELEKITEEDDSIQDEVNKSILKIVKVFTEQDYSGFSGNYVISKLDRLLRFKPLEPLTGEDSEWDFCFTDETGTSHYINNRCPSVGKSVDKFGNVKDIYDVDAYVLSDDGGISWFSTNLFKKQIEFPYYPPVEAEEVYIEFYDDVPNSEYDIITDQPERIKELRERKQAEHSQGRYDA